LIFMPALDALREVHATGVLHRDISPDNLLIDINGRVVLIDFGAARQAMGEQSKSLSVIMKAGYSPVEQYFSKGEQGPWTDIYAIASSFYRTVTGQIPSESMGRILQDDLVLPSQLGIKIDGSLEKILLKALAVKAEDRYQSVEEFQSELYDVIAKGKFSDGDAEVKPKRKTGAEVEAEEAREKKPGAAQQPAGRVLTSDSSYTISDKIVLIAIVAILCGLLIVGTFSLINSGKKADYYIDYTSGTISIGDLPIGARVIDPTWEWEFQLGDDYSGSGEKKPVAWIIVAKDHYDGLDPHVTLLADEIIGKHAFDNSTGRKHTLSLYGYNNWGESGAIRATRGLRPWLNSTGIHYNEGFYLDFSDSFKEAIISTTLPNKEWENGAPYITVDTVFLPSTTELGDRDYEYTYPVGSTYTYFIEAGNADRVAWLGGEACPYWTRSPDSGGGYGVRGVTSEGDFNYFDGGANRDYNGVRPALNLKADTMVSTIRN
jgi:hypothetical protein